MTNAAKVMPQDVAPAACLIPPAHSAEGLSSVKVGKFRILLIATMFKMPYRVLRCAQAAGGIVYAYGGQYAMGLRRSRYCAEFMSAGALIVGQPDDRVVDEINGHIDRLGIDMVLAGDAMATRTLISIRDQLRAPCFPMPTLSLFDWLNDKWRFGELCRSLGILYPKTRLYDDRSALEREISAATLKQAHIAKPVNMDNGTGCIVVNPATASRDLASISYEPILFQEFIEGEDIGASVYCERGEIRSFIAHRYSRDTYTTFTDPAIVRDVTRLMKSANGDGVFNFDMRLTPDGRIFYLECNPRFFFKIALSMLAGINFVAPGLPMQNRASQPAAIKDTVVRFPKALLAAPWKLNAQSWKALGYVLSDPQPYVREELGYYNNVPVTPFPRAR
jgi:hypothetical protein